MLEKYRKLIISQLCAVFGIGAAILGFLRYQQIQSLTEQVTLSFFIFAVALFGMELKLVIDWVKTRNKQAT